MKKKTIKFSVNKESVNRLINNSFYKQNNFTSNTNTINFPLSSERNEVSNGGKKILNQQEINNW